MYYHLRNSSGTGWCVAGTSDGLFTGSWDRINPGKPAQDAVYGAPYTGCGYCFYSFPALSHYTYYAKGSSTQQYGDSSVASCPSGYLVVDRVHEYANGCGSNTSGVCPVAGYHLPAGREGRPHATLISPSVPATPETYPYTGAPHYCFRPHITTTIKTLSTPLRVR